MQEIKINEKLVKYNFSSRNGEKIKYISIHDTGNKRTSHSGKRPCGRRRKYGTDNYLLEYRKDHR